MGRAAQRKVKLRKAMRSMPPLSCPEPDKQKYPRLHDARVAAERQPDKRLRPYPCGRHYHLTSKVGLWR